MFLYNADAQKIQQLLMLVFFHQISWMSCCRERTECSTSGPWGSGGWTSASNMLCLNAAQNRCVLGNECILHVYVATSNKAECIHALFHSVVILLRIRWSSLACIGIKSASWFASSIQLQLPFDSVFKSSNLFFLGNDTFQIYWKWCNPADMCNNDTHKDGYHFVAH